MELSKNEIYKRINQRKFNISKTDILIMISNVFKITKKILSKYDFNKLEKSNKDMNPLLWEYGHFLNFWEKLVIKNLNGSSDLLKSFKYTLDNNYYDSYLLSKTNRFFYYDKLLNSNKLYKIMFNIENLIIIHINENFDKINYYLIYLGLLHQHMHNESFIFSLNQIDIDPFDFINNYDYNERLENISFVNIIGGSFNQGALNDGFYFDNEYPMFKTNIENFKVSKYLITNGQFIKFIDDGGYTNKDLYSPEGYRYIQINKNSKNKNMPKSWLFKDGSYYEKIFGKIIKLRYNHPVCVTWYEANAFCKLYNYRMLKEKEWEYIAKNNNNSICNYNFPQSILKEKNENMGVYGLYGNYWEWCEEPIYPYDGFVIDPVYREMSYPFFGYKKICRGGAWCVPNFLSTKTYRNAQMPDCDYQFISFRVCK